MPACVAIKRDGHPCTFNARGTDIYCGRHTTHLTALPSDNMRDNVQTINQYSTQYASVAKLYIDMFAAMEDITTADELMIVTQNEQTYAHQLTVLEVCLKRLGIHGCVPAAITFKRRIELSRRYVERISELVIRFVF